jgi:hypothetical protein
MATSLPPVVVNQINKMINELADDNYQHWRFQISLVLKAAKVWTNVSGAIPRPPSGTGADDWDAKDVQAMAIIVTTLNQVNSNHVFAYTTSKEMFDKLKSIHADSSMLNKQHTLSAFLNFKIGPEKTLGLGIQFNGASEYCSMESTLSSMLDILLLPIPFPMKVFVPVPVAMFPILPSLEVKITQDSSEEDWSIEESIYN